MRIAIETLVTLLLAFFAFRLGLPWPFIFALAYLFAYSRKWVTPSRKSLIPQQALVSIAVFLAACLILGWGIGLFLFSEEIGAEIQAVDFFRFLMGSTELKVFWAAVLGCLGSALVTAGILIPYGFIAGQHLYSQYDAYEGNEREAALSAISVLIGISRGSFIVSDGKVETRGRSAGSLSRFGGPGFLVTQEGHAVILEQSGKLSRVVGRGITLLEPFEKVSMVVPLGIQSEKVTVEQIATKDRVFVEEFEVEVYHKVDAGPESERISNGLLPYNPSILVEKVWSPRGSNWGGAVRAVSHTAVRDIVGRFTLEEIATISDAFRRELT
jgi:hypothetical protein